jgi:hypothetical protein
VRILRVLLAVLLLVPGAPHSATPRAGAPAGVEALEAASLRTIVAWLQSSGRDGYLAGDVADVAGIPRTTAEDLLEARQRGFRSGETLRIAQVAADGRRDFLLFMVQKPDGEVTFYFATVREGLKKAFVSIPRQGAVLALQGAEARAQFGRELAYWEARVAGR